MNEENVLRLNVRISSNRRLPSYSARAYVMEKVSTNVFLFYLFYTFVRMVC